MSYILDALRKADQQRQHAKAPTLLSAQSGPETAKPSNRAFNIGLALALIGAGVFIGWLQPWQNRLTAPPDSPAPALAGQVPAAAEQTPTTTNSATTNSATTNSATNDLAEKSATSPASINSIPVTDRENTPEAISRKLNNAAPINPTQSEPELKLEANPKAEQIAKEKNAVSLTELPAAVKQQLPNIAIAFHQYSPNPAERRVMINNLVLKQGDAIAPGLTLEKITAEGVILSYQGYQFTRGVR
jgi:general secretion pathway protein B